MCYLAIDIGGTFTKFALMTENGTILDRGKTPTVKSSQEGFVESLVGLYDKEFRTLTCGNQTGGGQKPEAGENSDSREEPDGRENTDSREDHGDEEGTTSRKQFLAERIQGIAISCAGMIDSEKGILHNAGSLYCVKELPIVRILEDRCKVPVSIGNDARCAALAEYWKGVLRDCRNAAALVIGTAVGGTILIDGKVLEGNNHLAGEFSYIKANADAPEDQSRNYGLYGSMPALIGLASEAAGIPGEHLDGERIFALVRGGNEKVLASVRAYARRLAVLIMNLQFVVNPEKVAIGGGVSAEPMLIELIREELEKLAEEYPYPVPVPEIAACQYGNDANLIGALYIFLTNSS